MKRSDNGLRNWLMPWSTSGSGPGDRVATLGWNTHRHLEIYYATAGIGAVCHTINPRLHGDQITYIINDAEDRRHVLR